MKRLFDLSAALIGLVLLAPIVLILALLIRQKLGSPILFTQIRPSLHSKPFRMVKFRTMTDARDANGELLPDSMRLTPFGKFLRSSSLDELPGLWNVLKGDMSLVGSRPRPMEHTSIYKNFTKRLFDLMLSAIALTILSPFLIIFALLIRLSSQGPIFFKQQRLGLNGKPFTIYKFRTMTDKLRESKSEIFGKNSEVTVIGYWLRRLKIDETPQLINIAIGDMSIVGPRPALTEQVDDIKKNAPARLDVRPGLTGLAQINGNIHLPWPERWLYDIKYVKNISFSFDLKIILKTVLVVILGEKYFIKKYK